MMTTSFNARNFHKDGFLLLSALLTWALVSFIYLRHLDLNSDFLWRAIALLGFISLFFSNIFIKNNLANFSVIISAQVLILLVLIYFDNYQIIPILLALIATQLPTQFKRNRAMLIILVINTAYYVVLMQAHPSQNIFTVLIFLVLQLFAFSVIEATLREQHAKEELAAINQELLATRFMLKESSKKQERLRISRDLHDVLGHQLTALALNLEVTNHKVADQFKSLTEANLKQAKQLLQEVRNVVKEMRSEEQLDLALTLNTLIQQLPNCQLNITSPEPNNSIKINSLNLTNQLMFCLQEGISNALRHGHANNFILEFYKNEQQLIFCLIDNGSGYHNYIAGNGLNGMHERLANFNGEIELIANHNNNTPMNGCTLKIQVEDSYD
jgi:two-component system, NarL family, sensor histidine kinase DesK